MSTPPPISAVAPRTTVSTPAPVSAVAPRTVASTPAPAPVAIPAPAATPVAAVPRSSRNEGTVRELLPPWHVLQDKLQKGSARVEPELANEVVNRAAQEALAAQEAANANWGAPRASSEGSLARAPSSGVRLSEPGQPVHMPVGDEPVAVTDSLSFKVYTVADLDQAPPSSAVSRASLDLTSSRSSRNWQRVQAALVAFAGASLAWLKIKGDRPSIKVALRQPFDQLGDELQVAVEAVDWRKLGVTCGIVVGASLTLLFAVLTAAELTDDLKPPGGAAHLASSDTSGTGRTALDTHGVAPATNMAAMGVQPVAAPVPLPAPEAATSLGDIDDEPSAEAEAPRPAKKRAAKKAGRAKTSKLTMRSAPF